MRHKEEVEWQLKAARNVVYNVGPGKYTELLRTLECFNVRHVLQLTVPKPPEHCLSRRCEDGGTSSTSTSHC